MMARAACTIKIPCCRSPTRKRAANAYAAGAGRSVRVGGRAAHGQASGAAEAGAAAAKGDGVDDDLAAIDELQRSINVVTLIERFGSLCGWTGQRIHSRGGCGKVAYDHACTIRETENGFHGCTRQTGPKSRAHQLDVAAAPDLDRLGDREFPDREADFGINTGLLGEQVQHWLLPPRAWLDNQRAGAGAAAGLDASQRRKARTAIWDHPADRLEFPPNKTTIEADQRQLGIMVHDTARQERCKFASRRIGRPFDLPIGHAGAGARRDQPVVTD